MEYFENNSRLPGICRVSFLPLPVEVPVEVNSSPIELHLPVEAKENRAIIESKVKPSPVEVNNSTIEL